MLSTGSLGRYSQSSFRSFFAFATIRLYLAVAGILVILFALLFPALPAQAQQFLAGESDRVVLIPNGRTDAGVVRLRPSFHVSLPIHLWIFSFSSCSCEG